MHPATLALFMCAMSARLDRHDHNRTRTHCKEEKTDVTTTLTTCSRHAPHAPDTHPATHRRAPAPLTRPPLLDVPPPPQTRAVCLSTKGRLPTPPRLFPPCLAGVLVRVLRPITVLSHSPMSSWPSYCHPSPRCPSRLAASLMPTSHVPPSTSILVVACTCIALCIGHAAHHQALFRLPPCILGPMRVC